MLLSSQSFALWIRAKLPKGSFLGGREHECLMALGDGKVIHKCFVCGRLCACILRDPRGPAVYAMCLGSDWCAGVPGVWALAAPRLPDPGHRDDRRFGLCCGSQHCVSHPTYCPQSLSFTLSGLRCVFVLVAIFCLCLIRPLVRMAETCQCSNGSMAESKVGCACSNILISASNSYHFECFSVCQDCDMILWSTLSGSVFTIPLLPSVMLAKLFIFYLLIHCLNQVVLSHT